MADFMPDTAHAARIADLLQGFDASDLAQLRLKVALLVIEESPGLDTLCHACTMLRPRKDQEYWLPLMGSALQAPINRLYLAGRKVAPQDKMVLTRGPTKALVQVPSRLGRLLL